MTPLRDKDGAPLEFVAMGLGWDAAHRRLFRAKPDPIDLNAVALMFDGEQLVDAIYSEQLTSKDGAVSLHGDNLTGDGTGDDEIITIDLARVPDRITALALLVTCYTGQTFDRIDNAYCRLIDSWSATDIVRYELPAGPHTGFLMGLVVRGEPVWQFREIATGITARHPVDAVPLLTPYLSQS